MAAYHHYSKRLLPILKPLVSAAVVVICLGTSALCEEGHGHDHHKHGHHDHEEKAKRQHSAHEHGTVNLNLVVEGETIQIELLLPAVDVTGFGHKPRTSEETQTESRAVGLLKDTTNMFTFTKSADCKPGSVDVTNNSSDEDGHSEYRALYQVRCSKPLSLNEIELTIFRHFPSIEKVRGNTVVAGKQGKLMLTKDNQSILVAKK